MPFELTLRLACAATLLAPASLPGLAQTVLAGDHSITGALCVGFECTGSESFPSSTDLKLKDTDNRMLFEDTSSLAGYPTNDWMLVANGFGLNGEEYFALRDEDGARDVLRLDAGAPENALRIASSGRVGLGTAFPQTDLHIRGNIEAAIRFEDTSGTPFTWQLAGNDAGFYLYDPAANAIPFEVRAGAPGKAVYVASDGDLGLGTGLPGAALHLQRGDGTARLLVEETSGTTGPRTLLELKNNGRPEIVMGNTATGGEWSFGAGTNFILKQGAVGSSSAAKTKLFEVKANGDATLTGSLTTGGGTCGGGCDAVFTENRVIPASEYHAQMWAQGFLPHVGPTPENAPFNVTEKLGGMLNALEHAHVHNARQAEEIAAQAARIARLEADLAALRRAAVATRGD